MVKVQASKTVNAPANKIFFLISDFENLPARFPSRYKSVRILERSGNAVTVEETVSVAGREIQQKTRHEMSQGQRLKSEVIEGDTKGSVVEIMLEPDSSRTKVSIDAELKLGRLGSVLGMFAKGKIRGGLEHMIEEFESVVNSGLV